jgi:hypothetical protein
MEDNTVSESVADAFDDRRVDFSTFGADITMEDWATKYRVGDIRLGPFFFYQPIETLGPVKTVGLGRTNLTLVMATIVQTDAAVPYAGFDRQATPSRNSAVSVHFAPSAYGITSVGTYVMAFTVETSGPCTFTVGGFAGSGSLSGAGSKSVNGKQIITLILKDVQPSQQAYGSIEQTAGSPWTWYSTRISYPPLVFQV